MVEDKKDDKQPIDNINLKIFGLDLGELVKEKVEAQRQNLQKAQEQLSKKYGDAIRFDYDIKIGSLVDGPKDIRIGGGNFFQNLNDPRRKPTYRQAPVMRIETPKEQETREPLADVSDREGYLYVTVELPGVNEQDIKVNVCDQKIVISSENSERKYHTEIPLSTKVTPTPIKQTYKNGVLEIELKKDNE